MTESNKIDKTITKLKKKNLIREANTLLNYLRSFMKFMKNKVNSLSKKKITVQNMQNFMDATLHGNRSETLSAYADKLAKVYS